MDGLAVVGDGPAITPAFWGLIRTPPEKRDAAAIKASQDKTVAAMQMLDAQFGKTPFVAGHAFSYGDIPVGVMCYRYRQLVPDRPATPNLDRWYDAIASAKPSRIRSAACRCREHTLPSKRRGRNPLENNVIRSHLALGTRIQARMMLLSNDNLALER